MFLTVKHQSNSFMDYYQELQGDESVLDATVESVPETKEKKKKKKEKIAANEDVSIAEDSTAIKVIKTF